MADVKIYSSDYCPYCQRAKALLRERGVTDWEEICVDGKPAERAAMMALVRQVASGGVTVLYTEHNMDAVFGVADRVLVLMQGRLVADGTPEAVAQDPQVRERYLGLDFDMSLSMHSDMKGARDARG